MGGARVTIRDVAARAGVSVSTVSKVVNHRYGVSPGMDARVRAVIAELGYEAGLSAQSLRSRRGAVGGVIGVLVADLEPFNAELLRGIGDGVRGSGFELVIYCAGGRAVDQRVGWERRYLSRLTGMSFDGAILVTPTVVDVRTGAPVVAVDPHTGPATLPTVDSDNLRGAQLATRHLLDLGHRRIAMVAGRSDLLSAQLRERGFRETMEQAGVAVDPELVQVGNYDPQMSAATVRRMLESPAPPTAVFAANDRSALAAIAVAGRLGLRVPQDLSIVGFDDIPDAAQSMPPLTTVAQPIKRMGRTAVELLIRLIRGEDPQPVHITLDTSLVVRASTQAL